MSWNASWANSLKSTREEWDRCHGYTVYGHLTPSHKWYFGITGQSPTERWRRGEGYRAQHFARAIDKYGWDNIYHHIVATGLTKEQAFDLERELIKKYDTTNNSRGYNVASGGEDSVRTDKYKVKCLETGNIYDSVIDAANSIGVHVESIRRACRGESLVSGGLHWRYIDRHQRVTPAKHTTKGKLDFQKVRCVETGQTFDSATAAAKHYQVSISAIVQSTKHGRTCKGFHFQRVSFLDENR